MRTLIISVLLTCAFAFANAQVNIIITIAGKAGVPASDSGDGGPASAARFFAPCSLCLNKAGDIFIADAGNNRIRKLSASIGLLTTIAGSDSVGFGGDGGLAINALLNIPQGIRLDADENIYFADALNNRIRKINAVTGIISTVAGNGVMAYSGDRGPATDAALDAPYGVCFDKHGNLYFSDLWNNVVRRVNTSGMITTYAGNGEIGYSGDGGLAINAKFSDIIDGICIDTSDNLYICDDHNSAIRKVDASTGIITTIAGNGTIGHSGDGGLAIHATLSRPAGLYCDNKNNIYIAEFAGYIRRIDGVTGIITTIAGNGTWGWAGDGGPATDAELTCTDLAIDNSGCIIVADYGTNTIRKIYSDKLAVPPSPQSMTAKIWPNPCGNELHISGNAGSRYIVLTIDGVQVLQGTLCSPQQVIDVTTVSPGLYMIELRDKQQVQRNTVVVLR